MSFLLATGTPARTLSTLLWRLAIHFSTPSPGDAKRRGRYILYINCFAGTLSESRGQAIQRCSRWLPSQTRSAS
ncbi:hypothetical protein AZE42_09642 [Rhizopogon vesiculosus]|uniref:Uncharacterized protein n=1 Tax=Rhizopogon vesiculosus TaxID=180088 RepID=A0A1J8RCI9_9AGAM|nr:hypothetical protein AZE42_09642 [Rhizopogon vesiculosus]